MMMLGSGSPPVAAEDPGSGGLVGELRGGMIPGSITAAIHSVRNAQARRQRVVPYKNQGE
jgi:hypothetical protein